MPTEVGEQQSYSGWQPVLSGALRDSAEECALSIIDALAPLSSALEDDLVSRLSTEHGVSLSRGVAGLALLYHYAARAYADRRLERLSVSMVNAALDGIATRRSEPSLFGGFVGVAWAAAYLQSAGVAMPDEVDLAPVDAILLRYVSSSTHVTSFDLISGIVGIGVYALQRYPESSAIAIVERIVDRLYALAESVDGGFAWFDGPEAISPMLRPLMPDGCYNLGMAHGAPGIIAMLAAAAERRIGGSATIELLQGAVRWLLRHRCIGNEATYCFPGLTPKSGSPYPGRTAWCYGDPGIAVALLAAARATGDMSGEAYAVELARVAARRLPENTGVVDAGICHGAAGLAHIYNRLYQGTHDSIFATAAESWVVQVLRHRAGGTGICGFTSRMAGPGGGTIASSAVGLLEGVAGIALSLLATISALEPTWDAILLTRLCAIGR